MPPIMLSIRAWGFFAGLNVLPKCTAMSTYSYGLSATQVHRLQKTFVQQVHKLGYYDESIINLDFHTIPHFGDESVLQKHWAGARNKTMKGALTLMAQDAESKLILYTAADIHRDEADDQVLEFLAYWNKINRKVKNRRWYSIRALRPMRSYPRSTSRIFGLLPCAGAEKSWWSR